MGSSRTKQRRTRRRADIQLRRKAIRRGECPCEDVRIEDPGPHIAACAWADEDDDGPCWCGEPNPAYLTDGLVRSCGGSGVLYCRCGGDFCVCHHHGEVECPGCDECGGSDGDDWDEDGDDWGDDAEGCA